MENRKDDDDASSYSLLSITITIIVGIIAVHTQTHLQYLVCCYHQQLEKHSVFAVVLVNEYHAANLLNKVSFGFNI